MWKLISKYSNQSSVNIPDQEILLSHFRHLAKEIEAPYFTRDYEDLAKQYLQD